MGVDTDVVLQVDPRRESGVQLLEGAEACTLRFALKIVFYRFIDGFHFSLAITLEGFVVDLADVKLGEDPGELLGDINTAVVQVIPNSG